MKFFDGMDDDGNPQNNGAFNKKQKSGRTPAFKPDVALMKEPCKQEVVLTKEDNVLPLRKHESVPKLSNKPLNTASGPGRPLKPTSEQRVNPTQKLQKKTDKPNIPRRPSIQAVKIRCTNEDTVQEKLEAAKRRLQERYQEAENAKRQRTIQIMELHDLPKQGLAKRNPHHKSGNSNRSWANGRR
ncbi:hypothetical protein V2J09_014466 [Rumex salicifolius]